MSHAGLGEERTKSQPNGSDLCLACGLCCNGVLFDQGVLLPTEFNLAHEIGLTILAGDDNEMPTFRMPCPCFQQGRCSTYRKRPEACGRYRCDLLQALKTQEIDLDAALEQVAQAKALIAEIELLIEDTNVSESANETMGEAMSIWQRAQQFAKRHGLHLHSTEFTRSFPQIQLKISALYLLCDRHFEHFMSKPADG